MQTEHRSNIKPQSIWQSPRFKMKKKLWNFMSAKERTELPDYGTKIVNRGKGVYSYGPFNGTLADIKEFAKLKNISILTMGAVKIKI